jgi:hypothetical protein
VPAWLIGLAVVVVAAIVAGVIWGIPGGKGTKSNTAGGSSHNAVTGTQPVPLPSAGPGCPNLLPAGASPAATAYVHALNMAAPSWAAVSAKLAAEGRYTHLSDLAPQAAADQSFLTYLRQITFPAGEVATANTLISAVARYRDMLLAEAKDFSLFDQQSAERQRITDIRSAASSQLRAELGLPQTTCGYWRP